MQLLSLQPGAVFIPVNATPTTVDPRYGAVTGARADQQNVTLDGVDVNDTQNQTAYTSAVRVTQEALQEFRVSTSNYNADSGRSSGPQVSLVTRSGTNQFNGSGYWTFRRTETSSNEYFLKLAQPAASQEAAQAGQGHLRRIDRRADSRNRLFFFGNFERLKGAERDPGRAGGAVQLVPRRRPHVSVCGRRRPARAARSAASPTRTRCRRAGTG